MPTEVTALKPIQTQDAPYQDAEVTLRGTHYRFRELSVEENDECSEGAKEADGLINGRTMMRLAIMAAAVEPKITPEALAKMPQSVYLAICDLVNGLLDPAEPDVEDSRKKA